jgi:NNP family nitrate/nitrite transporter-like MFS transporter
MGIFGAGNSGAALTNLIVPLLMSAYGWETVPMIFAVGMLIVAILFWILAKNDPQHSNRQQQATAKEQLAPLKEWRVWRFSLYYFFTFGGFLALTLWLPKYYVGAYALDIKTASFLTLLFTLPTGLVRALGGVLADILGARPIMWGTFWISLICLFFLSYPPTTMMIHGIGEVIHITLELNQWVFTILILILGICMGLGNASLFKHIHDYYPQNIGSVGGMVGVMGGLGGFTLPILFGLAADLTQIRSSCFMLLYGLLACCMVLMHFGIKSDEYQQRVRDAHASKFIES